jgi:hypothetical protein
MVVPRPSHFAVQHTLTSFAHTGLLSDAIKQLREQTMTLFNGIINSTEGTLNVEDIDVMEEVPEEVEPPKAAQGVKRNQAQS